MEQYIGHYMSHVNIGESIDTGQRFETPSTTALNQLVQTIHRIDTIQNGTITILAFQPSEYLGFTAGNLLQGVTQPEIEQFIINQAYTGNGTAILIGVSKAIQQQIFEKCGGELQIVVMDLWPVSNTLTITQLAQYALTSYPQGMFSSAREIIAGGREHGNTRTQKRTIITRFSKEHKNKGHNGIIKIFDRNRISDNTTIYLQADANRDAQAQAVAQVIINDYKGIEIEASRSRIGGGNRVKGIAWMLPSSGKECKDIENCILESINQTTNDKNKHEKGYCNTWVHGSKGEWVDVQIEQHCTEQVDTMQQILKEIGAHMWPTTETHYTIRADHNQWQEMQQKTRGNGLKLITHGIRAPKRITISKNIAEQCHELCWVPPGANLTYEYEIAGLPYRLLGEELVEHIRVALVQIGLTIQEEQIRWEKTENNEGDCRHVIALTIYDNLAQQGSHQVQIANTCVENGTAFNILGRSVQLALIGKIINQSGWRSQGERPIPEAPEAQMSNFNPNNHGRTPLHKETKQIRWPVFEPLFSHQQNGRITIPGRNQDHVTPPLIFEHQTTTMAVGIAIPPYLNATKNEFARIYAAEPPHLFQEQLTTLKRTESFYINKNKVDSPQASAIQKLYPEKHITEWRFYTTSVQTQTLDIARINGLREDDQVVVFMPPESEIVIDQLPAYKMNIAQIHALARNPAPMQNGAIRGRAARGLICALSYEFATGRQAEIRHISKKASFSLSGQDQSTSKGETALLELRKLNTKTPTMERPTSHKNIKIPYRSYSLTPPNQNHPG